MLTVNMDDEVKREFISIVNEFGLNATSAVNLFARTVVRERRIPFELSLAEQDEKKWREDVEAEMRRGWDDVLNGRTLTRSQLDEYLSKMSKAS